MNYVLKIIARLTAGWPDERRRKLEEFLRFCVVGVIAAGLHYGIYYGLQFYINVNVAYTVGYLISLVCNFFLTSYLTFRTVPSFRKAVGFGGSHLVNYLLHIFLFNGFLQLGVSRALAPLLVLAIAVPTNFVLLSFVFHRKKQMKNHVLQSSRQNPKSVWAVWPALLSNLLLVYVGFALCRLLFFVMNRSYYPDMTLTHFGELFQGGLMFDTSAIVYTNALYILGLLLPLHWKENRGYHRFLKGLFVITNSLVVIMNLMDTVYFTYTNKRTTSSVFSQFSNEDNLARIVGIELLNHWYLVLLAGLFVYAFIRLYRMPQVDIRRPLWRYYVLYTGSLLICIPFCVFGMRGGIGGDVRPITISNANQYVNRPVETAIVLNTPFSIYRTLGKKPFAVPAYFRDETEAAQYFTPIHIPADSVEFRPKNVVVFIMESFGKEYIGALNRQPDGGTYQSYTPFLDSLITHSMVFDYSFANGRASIDGMPSALSGIPMFVEAFFLTPASLNRLSSISGELKHKGYYTAFFHGARRGSMGFQAFARSAGYQDYFGREDYGNDADFDGNWAIWDEEFFQYYADQISTFPEPFSVGLFSATSHHPFNIPDRYRTVFPEGPLPIHKCIRYSDHALKRFFEKASRQPWFKNTLFVITADHTNQTEHPEYQTELGVYSVPVIFYTPDGELTGRRPGIAQQIDIMPTVLGYLGYDRPYVTFGCDLIHTPADQTFAVNYQNGVYQYLKGDYMIQFDGQKTVAVYAFKTDSLLRHNLLSELPAHVWVELELELKSMIQQYMDRMNSDRLTFEP